MVILFLNYCVLLVVDFDFSVNFFYIVGVDCDYYLLVIVLYLEQCFN